MYSTYEALRNNKGVRDADVSKATGIPQSTFTDWKNGKYVPKVEKLLKLADYFQVSLDEFIRKEKQ